MTRTRRFNTKAYAVTEKEGRGAGTDIRAIPGAIGPHTDSESSRSPFWLGRHVAEGSNTSHRTNLVFPVHQSAMLPRARSRKSRDISGITLHSITQLENGMTTSQCAGTSVNAMNVSFQRSGCEALTTQSLCAPTGLWRELPGTDSPLFECFPPLAP